MPEYFVFSREYLSIYVSIYLEEVLHSKCHGLFGGRMWVKSASLTVRGSNRGRRLGEGLEKKTQEEEEEQCDTTDECFV